MEQFCFSIYRFRGSLEIYLQLSPFLTVSLPKNCMITYFLYLEETWSNFTTQFTNLEVAFFSADLPNTGLFTMLQLP